MNESIERWSTGLRGRVLSPQVAATKIGGAWLGTGNDSINHAPAQFQIGQP